MSRSEYQDDWDGGDVPPDFYRRAVKNALTSKRGQSFLRELADTLDAMPEKRLIDFQIVDDKSNFCALGTIMAKRGIDHTQFILTDADAIGKSLRIAPCVVREIEWVNDEAGPVTETEENRWIRVREWVAKQIKTETAS